MSDEPTPPATAEVDFAEDESVSRSFREAVREALDGHARKGNRVAVWKNGRPAWVWPKLWPLRKPGRRPGA